VQVEFPGDLFNIPRAVAKHPRFAAQNLLKCKTAREMLQSHSRCWKVNENGSADDGHLHLSAVGLQITVTKRPINALIKTALIAVITL
jgi:hypothetical protein